MPEYQLEIKQIVDYPRCRIYREFIKTLIDDRNIRTNDGCSGLFYYIALCAYASSQTLHSCQNGIRYSVSPGEGFCSINELKGILHLHSFGQILDVLYGLQDDGLIQFRILDRGRLVKYFIADWHRHNTVLKYNCLCRRDTGCFFVPYTAVIELLSMDKCSEMDILLDLWLSAVYRDERIQGSFDGPIVYLRNESGSPFVSYSMLAKRWGRSKLAVKRILKKLCQLGYLSIFPSPHHKDMVLYLQNYPSAAFQISDILVDKDELPLSLHLSLFEKDDVTATPDYTSNPSESIFVQHVDAAAAKVLRLLALQGIACGKCSQCSYQLSRLHANNEDVPDTQDEKYRMETLCNGQQLLYRFELTIRNNLIGVASDGKEKCVK